MESRTRFDTWLKDKWKELYESKEGSEIFRSNLKDITLRPLDGNFVAFYSASLFATKRETQIDFGKGKEASLAGDKSDLEVYKDFIEEKFNFNKISDSEILFFLKIDEEECVSVEDARSIDKQEFLGEEELEHDITRTELHPIVVNVSPICVNHVLLSLFPQEELPQVIGAEILPFMLQTFRLTTSPSLR
jgi:hypothetical protein